MSETLAEQRLQWMLKNKECKEPFALYVMPKGLQSFQEFSHVLIPFESLNEMEGS